LLHEITMSGGGARDSVRADRDGRYRLTVARPDSGALYMVSAAYRGITYFSQAILAREWQDTVPVLEVFDTTSTGAPITVGQRHVVIRRGGDQGGRNVLELITLANRDDRTRVSPDSVSPVWAGRLPAGISAFQVGESDVSAEAIELRGDRVVVTAPLPPGQKQIVFTYVLPANAREVALPVDHPTGRLLVLLEDTAATLVDGPLERRGVEVFDDTQFALFDGAVPAAGTDVVFRFTRRGVTANTVAIGVAVLSAVLLVLAVPLLRRRSALSGLAAPSPDDTPETLARAIAALDTRFEAGPRTSAAEAEYRERRAALKARLAARLGARR
jgi:hypothetical protein